MNNDEFLRRLSELAEWEIPKISGNGNPSRPKKSEEDDLPLNESDDNNTLAPKIIKVHPIIKPCEDCGKVCEDRRVYHKLHYTVKAHWREYCTACQCYKDPASGKFCLTSKQSQVVWQTALRSQGKYKSKYHAVAKSMSKPTETKTYVYEVIETDTGLIKKRTEKTDLAK